MSEPWSNIEVQVIVADYLDMLTSELQGKPFNKTEHRQKIKSLLKNRSDGSIEFKHQNISAALIRLGLPFIKGYKPRWNYQGILEDELARMLENDRPRYESAFMEFTERAPSRLVTTDFSNIIETPPVASMVAEEKVIYQKKRPIKINYLEKEQQNTALGLQGEELILNYEKWRLTNTGREKWAEGVEWVSKEDDSAGFDILSRNDDGSDRYIEVKTTKLTKETPIFFSKNEFDFAFANKTQYNLYRVFNFNENPRFFTLNGDFDSFCRKEATNFKGTF